MKKSQIIAATLVLFAGAVHAEPAWVSDQFEITLRTGPSTGNAIQMTLGSGAEIDVLERDAESGYSRVRTSGGTEGWVLTRYLMDEPSAREQLQRLTTQLTNVTSQGDSLENQLQAVRGEYVKAEQTIGDLERRNEQLQGELDDIKRTAANAIALNNQNSQLRDELANTKIQMGALEEENRSLSSQNVRHWFVAGAGVTVLGIILGLWLPRIKRPRRSRYDSF